MRPKHVRLVLTYPSHARSEHEGLLDIGEIVMLGHDEYQVKQVSIIDFVTWPEGDAMCEYGYTLERTG